MGYHWCHWERIEFNMSSHLWNIAVMFCIETNVTRPRPHLLTSCYSVFFCGLCNPASSSHHTKLQLNQLFSSFDINLHVFKLWTSSGHLHFKWRHNISPFYRPYHPVSPCEIPSQSVILFPGYGHTCFEIDDIIRPRPLLVTSQCLISLYDLSPCNPISACNSIGCLVPEI